jgi:hypothetical protein
MGGGGNCGVLLVGVFGEELSCADSGESSTTSIGSGFDPLADPDLRGGTTDVAVELDEPFRPLITES